MNKCKNFSLSKENLKIIEKVKKTLREIIIIVRNAKNFMLFISNKILLDQKVLILLIFQMVYFLCSIINEKGNNYLLKQYEEIFNRKIFMIILFILVLNK